MHDDGRPVVVICDDEAQARAVGVLVAFHGLDGRVVVQIGGSPQRAPEGALREMAEQIRALGIHEDSERSPDRAAPVVRVDGPAALGRLVGTIATMPGAKTAATGTGRGDALDPILDFGEREAPPFPDLAWPEARPNRAQRREAARQERRKGRSR